MRLIDVEGDWRFTHQDLGRRSALAGGRPEGDVTRRNHGTNVLGMLLGVHDARGVDGICPEAAVRAVSYQPEDRWGSARAIAYAAGELRPGDILLIEMQRPGPRAKQEGDSQDGYLPMSYWPDDLTAIQYAAGRGVIVVEAAGNGAEHLDDAVYAGPGPGFRPHRPNPFLRDGLDSGSILVGAGAPPGGRRGPDRSRLRFSNWGSRARRPGLGARRRHHRRARRRRRRDAARRRRGRLVHGRLRGHLEPPPRWSPARSRACRACCAPRAATPLDPAQARAALRETGSPQQAAKDGSLQRIGNRPDIGQLIEWAHGGHPARPGPRHHDPGGQPMKVTITIEDDGEGRHRVGRRRAARGPAHPGPPGRTSGGRTSGARHIVIPREDGTETHLDIAALEAAAEERKPQA